MLLGDLAAWDTWGEPGRGRGAWRAGGGVVLASPSFTWGRPGSHQLVAHHGHFHPESGAPARPEQPRRPRPERGTFSPAPRGALTAFRRWWGCRPPGPARPRLRKDRGGLCWGGGPSELGEHGVTCGVGGSPKATWLGES